MQSDNAHRLSLTDDRKALSHSSPAGDADSGRWGDLVDRIIGDRRVRYILIGAIAAFVNYVAFAAGWLLFAAYLPYLGMAVIANVLGAMIMYPLYRHVVFRATGPWLSGFLRFYLTCFWALTFAFVGLPLLVEVVHLHVLLAQAIIIIVSPLINYQIMRFWAFRPR